MSEASSPSSPPEALVKNYKELVQLLQRDGVSHQANVSSSEVLIPTQRAQLDSVLILRWQEPEAVLQFIQPLNFEIPESRLNAMDAAVARLNPVLIIAGFEISHELRRVAFRSTLPLLPRGGLAPGEIQTYFRVAVKTAADFMPTLMRIAAGQAEPTTIVADAKRDFAAAEAAAMPASKTVG